ncbi:hypothetical protein OVY01_07350 [Robbsia sp. Bb-Pol-6]|uniref:Uncharacterized protein n=1 Tax=Robbsia betulipollinis TaxID=2981849 RepID=A0ABT3ZKI6_9BURK|nr:hypothetical protein [Robbsia betulipollinis]MCY0387051.1 hypothetical protein [Robbsia betulipollinis]
MALQINTGTTSQTDFDQTSSTTSLQDTFSQVDQALKALMARISASVTASAKTPSAAGVSSSDNAQWRSSALDDPSWSTSGSTTPATTATDSTDGGLDDGTDDASGGSLKSVLKKLERDLEKLQSYLDGDSSNSSDNDLDSDSGYDSDSDLDSLAGDSDSDAGDSLDSDLDSLSGDSDSDVDDGLDSDLDSSASDSDSDYGDSLDSDLDSLASDSDGDAGDSLDSDPDGLASDSDDDSGYGSDSDLDSAPDTIPSTAVKSAASSTTSTATSNTASATSAATSTAAATSATQTASVDGGGPNSLTINNTTDEPMTVAFFRNLSSGTNPSFDGADAQLTIPAGGTAQVSMPADWQGRVQKFDGSTQDKANWGEINFEQSTGKVWFDESDIPGRNASIKMTADDGTTAGTDKSVLGDAPSDVVTTDSAGQKVIDAPQWFTGGTNQNAVNYLDQSIGNSTAYVLPDDNNAVRVSDSHHLTIDMGNA